MDSFRNEKLNWVEIKLIYLHMLRQTDVDHLPVGICDNGMDGLTDFKSFVCYG